MPSLPGRGRALGSCSRRKHIGRFERGGLEEGEDFEMSGVVVL